VATPSIPKTPPPEPRWVQRTRAWLMALPALAVTGLMYYWLVRAGRSTPLVAHCLAGAAVLALVLDLVLLLRGGSMILVMGVIFASAAVMSLVPRLALAIPAGVLTGTAYVGLILLIAFRKKK
jgi:hypothetical protein